MLDFFPRDKEDLVDDQDKRQPDQVRINGSGVLNRMPLSASIMFDPREPFLLCQQRALTNSDFLLREGDMASRRTTLIADKVYKTTPQEEEKHG